MPNIEVYVRMRPVAQNQQQSPNQRILLEPQTRTVKVLFGLPVKAKQFRFDGVFDKQTKQPELYEGSGIQKMVDSVVEGYNSTILVYGQTGAGKTYTMEGTGQRQLQSDGKGIIPRVMADLFRKVEIEDRETRVSLSFVQIYKEKVYDLFNRKSQKLSHCLKLRWNKIDQFVVDKLKVKQCLNLDQALNAYYKGARNKIMGKHRMNISSSRSHTILTIKVESWMNQTPQNVLTSKFCLVDLAGSEKQELTGTLDKHFKESVDINKSLFTLRQVITSIAEQSRSHRETNNEESSYVPYRDSKLTCLLKQSFGGNNFTMMIVCLNPSDDYAEQSIQSLSYAALTNKIKNVPVKGEDSKVIQITKLKQQLQQMGEQLSRANRHISTLTSLVHTKSKATGESTKLEQRVPQLVSDNRSKRQKSKEILDCQQSHQFQMDKIQNLQHNIQCGEAKTTKPYCKPSDILESLNMAKGLLTSNIELRDTINQLNKALDRRQKDMYQIMRQNQTLRSKCQLVSSGGPQEPPSMSQTKTELMYLSGPKPTSTRKVRLTSLPSKGLMHRQQTLTLSYHQFIDSRHHYKADSKKSKRKRLAIL